MHNSLQRVCRLHPLHLVASACDAAGPVGVRTGEAERDMSLTKPSRAWYRRRRLPGPRVRLPYYALVVSSCRMLRLRMQQMRITDALQGIIFLQTSLIRNWNEPEI